MSFLKSNGKEIDTRPIRYLVTEGEKNADVVCIEINRYYSNVDLSACTFVMRGVNANGEIAEQVLKKRMENHVLILEWQITEVFTVIPGRLQLELRGMFDDTLIIKYRMQPITIHCSLDGTGKPSPDVAEQILSQMEQILGAAQELTAKMPILQNGTWWLYNTESGVYEDSGLPAQGSAGKDGQDGKDGAEGEPGADGKDGTDGKSVYEIWLDAGNSGTEADFLKSLKGEKGDTGEQGIPGIDGQNGMNGKDGADGQDGSDGRSAYEIWLDAGNTGTEANFLESLKGEKGDTGEIPDTSEILEVAKNAESMARSVQADLVNYYRKLETYTQEEVNQLISVIPKFAIVVVSALPESNISPTTVYLLKSGSETDNLYTEYIYVNSAWETLGTQKIDLSGYYTSAQIDELLSYKVDNIPGMGLSANNFTDELFEKLSNVEVGANKTIVDATLSSSSTNPVQNKTVYAEFDKIDNAFTHMVDVCDVKNLLYLKNGGRSIVGLSITYEDGVIHVKGICNETYVIDLGIIGPYPLSGDFTVEHDSVFSITTDGDNIPPIKLRISIDGKTTNVPIVKECEIASGSKIKSMHIECTEGVEYDFTIKPMVRLSFVKDETFVPHVPTNAELAERTHDSGWNALELSDLAVLVQGSDVRYRVIGKFMFLSGHISVKSAQSGSILIANLPDKYKASQPQVNSLAYKTPNGEYDCTTAVYTNSIVCTREGGFTTSTRYWISLSFLID